MPINIADSVKALNVAAPLADNRLRTTIVYAGPAIAAAVSSPAWIPPAITIGTLATVGATLKILNDQANKPKATPLPNSCLPPRKIVPPKVDIGHVRNPKVKDSFSPIIGTKENFPPNELILPLLDRDDPHYYSKDVLQRTIKSPVDKKPRAVASSSKNTPSQPNSKSDGTGKSVDNRHPVDKPIANSDLVSPTTPQQYDGTCYFAVAIQALLSLKEGRELLKDRFQPTTDGGVKFSPPNGTAPIIISSDEIKNSDQIIGLPRTPLHDPKNTYLIGIYLAYNKFLETYFPYSAAGNQVPIREGKISEPWARAFGLSSQGLRTPQGNHIYFSRQSEEPSAELPTTRDNQEFIEQKLSSLKKTLDSGGQLGVSTLNIVTSKSSLLPNHAYRVVSVDTTKSEITVIDPRNPHEKKSIPASDLVENAYQFELLFPK